MKKLNSQNFKKDPRTMNMVIKKNNRITVFDAIVRKNIIQEFIKKGFKVLAVQY